MLTIFVLNFGLNPSLLYNPSKGNGQSCSNIIFLGDYFLADAICVKDCSFTWKGKEDNSPTLQYLNINIKSGQLVAVVGVVGSGKSSLISGLLGDMYKVTGQASVNVSII